MPIRMTLPPTLAARIAASDRPLFGAWSSGGSAVNAEIVAGSGLDVVLVDAEHSPIGLESVLGQLQAIAAYPATPLVRVPYGDTVTIKQMLDLGAQNLLVPMCDTAEHAAEIVRAVRYPPLGVRGVGSALARSARWNRVDGYLAGASSTISLFVQIESATAAANVERILDVDGVDGVFFGPADLAASMGLIGQQEHPEVVAAVLAGIASAVAAGKPAAVNAFVPAAADRYLAAGASFVVVGADVALLARATEALADRYIGSPPAADDSADEAPRASY
ncbi:2,4-dihydroxyhept-2-enedioate aldolase [Agromyces sp. CF514]|uniref:HpcH/HpaI aldolase family protein n=1 Tax=Agromyces sp. CF514 TaxID=1881031 RepID=UPI0008EBA73D|nr:HpcH/HpaI aldolase/citrate lyase family protein [Agromyces sp. CF514]SFR85700.1 2,4-dihydroxyhept-2-enedioate aldolase [Agromyces sp. CF514]